MFSLRNIIWGKFKGMTIKVETIFLHTLKMKYKVKMNNLEKFKQFIHSINEMNFSDTVFYNNILNNMNLEQI